LADFYVEKLHGISHLWLKKGKNNGSRIIYIYIYIYIYILFELFFILNKTTCQVIKRILIILDLIMDKKILFELRKIQVNNL
jgi:hypothetical protein